MPTHSAGIPGSVSQSLKGSLDVLINRANKVFANPADVFGPTLDAEIAYFDYGKGDLIQYPMRISGQSDEDKGDMESRNFEEDVLVNVASVGAKRVDLYGTKYPQDDFRDPDNWLIGEMREAIGYAVRLPTKRLAKRLREGTTKTCTFDGLTFFNTAHKCNPLATGAAANRTFKNYFAGIETTEDGWAEVMQEITQIEGAHGYKINANFLSERPIILTGNVKIWKKWMKIFDPAGLMAIDTATGTASETTVFKNGARLKLIPELIDANTAATLKRSYIIKPGMGRNRGLIVRMPKPPTWVSARGTQSPLGVTNDADVAYGTCKYGDDYGLPHMIFCVEEP